MAPRGAFRFCLPFLLALAGCGGSPPPQLETAARPLWTAGAPLDVLVEDADIALPPASGANRFLRGWSPARDETGTRQLIANRTAFLELSLLEPRAGRSLTLDLSAAEPSNAAADATAASPVPREVRLAAGGRPLGTFPLQSPVVVPLPADLAGARIPVELDFSTPTLVRAARLRGGLEKGDASWGEGWLELRGPAQADWLVEEGVTTRLVGSFAPAARLAAGQRFALQVESSPGEWREAFSWRPGWRERWGLSSETTVDFSVEVPAGISRLRFEALGPRAAGRWSNVGWAASSSPVLSIPMPATDGPALPRLVLVVVLDALRADFVGYQGGPAGVSPTLDRLASEGVVWTDHRSVAPNTLPATKALFTGMVPRTGGGSRLAADAGATLAERFAAAGYRTACFSGNPNVGPAFGTDRGFEHFDPETLHPGRWSRDLPFNNNARVLFEASRRWIQALAPADRAFVYLHTIHPHNPYAPPRDLERRFATIPGSRIDGSTRTLLDLSMRRTVPGPRDVERLRGLYAGSLAYADRELDRMLRAITRRVDPRDLLVVVTSDHGEEIGDHGGFLHGYTLYDEMLRVPLVFWSPQRLTPRRLEGTATDTVDLHATLLDWLGDQAAVSASEGRSLLPALRGGAAPSPTTRFAAGSSLKGGLFAAYTARHKLVLAPRVGDQWGMGNGVGRLRDAEFLYDLEADPRERESLVGDRQPLAVHLLRQRLRAWVEVAAANASSAETGDAVVDAETRARLQALGYLQ